jgi:hypothetical protein
MWFRLTIKGFESISESSLADDGGSDESTPQHHQITSGNQSIQAIQSSDTYLVTC